MSKFWSNIYASYMYTNTNGEHEIGLRYLYQIHPLFFFHIIIEHMSKHMFSITLNWIYVSYVWHNCSPIHLNPTLRNIPHVYMKHTLFVHPCGLCAEMWSEPLFIFPFSHEIGASVPNIIICSYIQLECLKLSITWTCSLYAKAE